MAADVIRSSLPDLVKAVSGCVQSVSDQCLAKGLIPESVYKRVLESGATCTSEDKARALVLAVKESTETDERCFELFLNILEQVLPSTIKNAVVLPLKECKDVVPFHGIQPHSEPLALIASGEIMKQQTSFFGKYEDAVRQHERACSEIRVLEENMRVKEEENERLKAELERVKADQIVDTTEKLSRMESTIDRISVCEADISELRREIQKVQSIIEEQGMQIKRGKSTVGLGLANFSQLAQKQIHDAKEMIEKKEAEHTAALRDQKKKYEDCEKQRQGMEVEIKARIQDLEDQIALHVKASQPFCFDDNLHVVAPDKIQDQLSEGAGGNDEKEAHSQKQGHAGTVGTLLNGLPGFTAQARKLLMDQINTLPPITAGQLNLLLMVLLIMFAWCITNVIMGLQDTTVAIQHETQKDIRALHYKFTKQWEKQETYLYLEDAVVTLVGITIWALLVVMDKIASEGLQALLWKLSQLVKLILKLSHVQLVKLVLDLLPETVFLVLPLLIFKLIHVVT